MNGNKNPNLGNDELQVLALNSGSSSLKFGVYQVDSESVRCTLSGEAEAIGEAGSAFHATNALGHVVVNEVLPELRQAVRRIGTLLSDLKIPALQAVGHRVVHGGPTLRAHCLIDNAVERALEAAVPFAPLHTEASLSIIRFAQLHFPGIPQVACFDTSFHDRMPPVARTLALPASLREQGMQRYGFHGLSCESIVQQLTCELPDRLIIAHLGNGASITAVRSGVSVDTTMGMTPTGGLIMGTRVGDLDPGVLVYLAREKRFDAQMLEDLVDRRGGLLGISGVGGDMRVLHKAAASNTDAALAVEIFCYDARKQLASMIAALGGADLIVFTGGIGENDADVRAKICGGLSWAGIDLDESLNRAAGPLISRTDAHCRVQVLPSREDAQIARCARTLVL